MGHAKQRILLVDDDPGIMVAVKQALSAHGYQMTTAKDGIEALDSFDREPPELILLDLVMPHCSGLEVCKRIREYSA
ncbi:MAG TPA: DNA-binding response regulator, partial [Ktedonobacter sp.]|nr:DNA-binding response regulator [Ktedonobacter sp.]